MEQSHFSIFWSSFLLIRGRCLHPFAMGLAPLSISRIPVNERFANGVGVEARIGVGRFSPYAWSRMFDAFLRRGDIT
jgi:hypothetical protein